MDNQLLLPPPNEKKLYWIEQIDLLREGKLTQWEKERCLEEASLWTTCACGALDEEIPRVWNADNNPCAPQDDLLAELGVDFYENWRAVVNPNNSITDEIMAHALSDILDRIQRRAIEVIQQVRLQTYNPNVYEKYARSDRNPHSS